MHVQLSVVLHMLTGFVSTNQLTLRNSKKIRFFQCSGKRKGRCHRGEGERKHHPLHSEQLMNQEFHKLQKDSSKQETKMKKSSVGLSKRLPPPSAQETQSDESGSVSCGKKIQEHK